MKTLALLLPAALLMLLMYKTDAKMEIITTTQDIRVGTEILLLCKAGGEGEITWQKDGEDIDDENVKKMDETSSKLTITQATMEDAGLYSCRCDFESELTDQITTQLYIFDGPSFGQTKNYHEFLEGTEGMVPCLVTGQPAVDVIWLRDTKPISSKAGGRFQQKPDNSLFIENVRREDAGTYTCQGQIRGRGIYSNLSVSVVVNVSPKVQLKEGEKKVLAGPETNVSLLCSVEGIPEPNITWTIPTTTDSSRHQFNSNRSQLIINSVTRSDYGEYVCTATNKIGESSGIIMLHVFEAPEVFVSTEQQSVSVGERVSVSCNVSGHPNPELHWINKHNGRALDTSSEHIYVSEGVLVIKDMLPSDGGLYSCMAVSTSGNASRDVAIHTEPGPPYYLSIASGPASVLFSLKTMPVNGGTPITGFVLQWKQDGDKEWKEISIPVSDPLVITNLKQYTSYTVRLAASNAVGVGPFSENKPVRTMGIQGEPDAPLLKRNDMKVERNTFYVPLQQVDQGASPLQNFYLRYRKDEDDAKWKEMQLSPTSDSISLQDLAFGSRYEVEVTAVNTNGSSVPGTFNFTIGEEPKSMTKGSVVGIVIVIFLVVFLIVDATCCYKNHCGLLMSIAVKVFGQKVPGMKVLDEESSNGERKLKGISTPRGSLQMGVKKEAGELRGHL
ncbi:neural cell adhesion molecule 1 [Takifugu rubripes]|uniref:neural cell adhesion molecule 1 n=1 Tax=Takifugu rubripes TaxID=31033 RepID=UPI001145E0C6|nr:neural cell adhesion molecule 1-like [Takifugu rubripes]